MTEQELISIIGKTLLDNWAYFTSAIIGSIVGGATLSWFLSNTIHKKEIRILQLQLSHNRDSFSQFQSIMEQRILTLQNEAFSLQEKISPSDDDPQTVSVNANKEENNNLDVPMFLRREASNNKNVAEPLSDYDVKNKISSLMEKTDMVQHIISIANTAWHKNA